MENALWIVKQFGVPEYIVAEWNRAIRRPDFKKMQERMMNAYIAYNPNFRTSTPEIGAAEYLDVLANVVLIAAANVPDEPDALDEPDGAPGANEEMTDDEMM